MRTAHSAATDFGKRLEAEIPPLRRYARALTRNFTRADDLVQNALVRAVSKQHMWEPGSNLRSWLFTILHNQYVNDVRRWAREGMAVSVEDNNDPVLTVQPSAFGCLQLRDLQVAMNQLSSERREVLLLVGLEGMNCADTASILGVPQGTVRSRLSRARDQLRFLMDRGEENLAERHKSLSAPLLSDLPLRAAGFGGIALRADRT